MKRPPRGLMILFGLSLALMYIPLVAIVLYSFNAASAPMMPITHLTTSWYGTLFHDEQIRSATTLTIQIAATAVIGCTLMATGAALAVRRRRFPGRSMYEFIIGMPFLLPEIVTGIALLAFFTAAHVTLSFATVLVGHMLYCVGAAFRIVAARLESLPSSLEEAAHDLGRGAFGTFFYVTLPGVRSALLTAALLVLALSLDQTVISIMVAGPENTLPTLLWAKMRVGFTPELNALATTILLATMLLALPLAVRSRGELR